MNFEWYLALRYFKGKRKGSRFLSFIKTMAITGVAVGSAGLLIALSIVHGFKSVINDKIIGFAPHITVTTFSDEPLYRADTLLSTLQQYPEIAQAQQVVTGQAMIQSSNEISGMFLKGVDRSGDISEMRSYINRGSYELGTDSAGIPGIILGAELAENLRTDIGDVLISYTIEGLPSPLNSPEIQQFRVTGIYQTGIDRFDDVFAMVDRQYARKLFRVPGVHASAVEIKLADPEQIQSIDSRLTADLPFPYFTETIFDRYGNIFAWVDLQESTIPFVISVMIIVAAFNLIGTILMMVLERTRDIGILKTIGGKDRSVKYVFLLEGFFVAVVGLFIGIALALLFVWLQSTWHIIPLSEQNYYMSYAPVEPHGLDFLLVSLVTIVLCTLASWIPARVAAKTDPLKVIAFGR
ncbi:MAG: ABC transporter permease [Balneolaceae bacterium]|nr:ABC transporter permease [Balneolaceae bacterium]